MATLIELAERYCCDKLYAHSYIDSGFYEELFRGRNVRRLLEIGIGYEDLMKPFVPRYVHGASLRMWEEYFPTALIRGCDIRQDTMLPVTERLLTVVADQSQPIEMLRVAALGPYSVIIDDGSHETNHQIMAAITLLPYLTAKGVYVVEDVREPDAVVEALGIGTVIRFNKRPDDCLIVIQK